MGWTLGKGWNSGHDVPQPDEDSSPIVDAVIEAPPIDRRSTDPQTDVPRRLADDVYASVLGEDPSSEDLGAEAGRGARSEVPAALSNTLRPAPQQQPGAEVRVVDTHSDLGSSPVDNRVQHPDRWVLLDPETEVDVTDLETVEMVDPEQASSGTGSQSDDGSHEAVGEDDAPQAQPEPAEMTLSESWLTELPRFGPVGRLTPHPRVSTAQPPSWVEQVPDTAIEWLDMGSLSVRGVSVRGHVHRYEGSVRQDQLAMNVVDDVLVCAIGDGVGSEDASHLGSAFVTRFVVSWPEVAGLAKGYCPAVLDCTSVAQMMGMEARNRGLEPRSLSSTLTFMVTRTSPTKDADGLSRWRVVVGQIGDSHAYLLRESHWERVGAAVSSRTDDDYASNVVSPLPRHDKARLIQLDLAEGDVLALTTDGVGNTMEDVREYADALARVWSLGAPTPAAMLNVLDGSVKSYDDDRTMLGIRFGADE